MVKRVAFEAGAKIQRWSKALDNPVAALKQIGALGVAESRHAFREQKFGKANWEPRVVPNVFGVLADFSLQEGGTKPPKRRFEQRDALVDTGRLKKSIAYNILSKRIVEWGTNLPYAAKHITGGRVESVVITESLQEKLKKWLKGQGDKWKEFFQHYLRPEWLGKKDEMEIPARPFVGLTRQLRKDIREAVGVKIFEVHR